MCVHLYAEEEVLCPVMAEVSGAWGAGWDTFFTMGPGTAVSINSLSCWCSIVKHALQGAVSFQR